MHTWPVRALLSILLVACSVTPVDTAVRGRLQVAANGRYLQYTDGMPFFYMGDTAWELFHRLNREEATQYLNDRARKEFTVIQTVALAERDGLTVPNAYGATYEFRTEQNRVIRHSHPQQQDAGRTGCWSSKRCRTCQHLINK